MFLSIFFRIFVYNYLTFFSVGFISDESSYYCSDPPASLPRLSYGTRGGGVLTNLTIPQEEVFVPSSDCNPPGGQHGNMILKT